MNETEKENDVFDLETYKIQKQPQLNTNATAVVIDILQGQVKDFIKQDVLHKWNGGEGHAINIIMEFLWDDRIIRRKHMIPLPSESKRFTKKHDLAKWERKFGKKPYIGQKVTLTSNADGFFNPFEVV